ncbi:MAG TPA: hypothetical protein VFS43_10580 [Polyangiaceae bacterium]|nr:hypothetical protein [Polyangiaceae bacterium]
MNALDLRRLLEPGADAGSIDLFGVRIGGSAAPLRDTPPDGAEPRLPGIQRLDGPFARMVRAGADGVEREVPLAQLFDEVLEVGGAVVVGGVRVWVAGGVVCRAFVRGPALDALGVEREADVVARFGEPAGYVRESGLRFAQYPARDFSVAWHVGENRLDHIVLGGISGWTEPKLGARELLDLLLESWNAFEEGGFAEPPESQQPLYHRYLRARALCAALGLGDVGEAAKGDFLERGDPSRYRRVRERLESASPVPPERGHRPSPQSDAESLAFVYRDLLRFRRHAYTLLGHNNGWLACSDRMILGAIATTDRAAEPLRASLEPVDAALLGFLDPEGRSFSQRELVERYGYSDVDLRAIDLDWL